MYRIIIASLCLILSQAVFADELKMPIGSQGDTNMTRPVNGMTKANVEKRFGAPENMKGPVGDPPISTWKYGSYTVYFEYDRVIHTVLHK
jgi:hypothetical protein